MYLVSYRVDRRALLRFAFTTFTFLLLTWPVTEVLGTTKTRPLPHVSPEMERPEFWIGRVKDPETVLLTPDQIRKMNSEVLKNPDLYLSRLADLKEEWSREELLELLREDWQAFGEPSGPRFGRNALPLNESFYKELRQNIDAEGIKGQNRIPFGLIVKRADIRVFPTEEPSLASPAGAEFDRFQHSMISPGTAVAAYHVSKDGHWAYLQTPFTRGWVKRDAVAVENNKQTVVQYEGDRERLVVTGNDVTLFRDPSLQKEAFVARMGDSFPLIRGPQSNGSEGKAYVVRIPNREKSGQLTFQEGYVRATGDVRPGFLPYTQANAARQAFKMLHQPYGWGEKSGGRDCSRFIMDIFSTFGIIMPRNSMFQARVGIDLGLAEAKGLPEREALLDRTPPLASTLRLPGHIMLYLGKVKGRYYAIHSIWGFQKSTRSGVVLEKIGRVAVTDLRLAEKGPHGSLLERLTDVRFIGEENGRKKHPNSP
jgi:cell wall-associated NlpC family hydrolase